MWPNPFVNLRASCEYDWLRPRPIDAVAAFTGHSPETMLRHDNRVFKGNPPAIWRGRFAWSMRPKLALRRVKKAKRRNRPPRAIPVSCERIRHLPLTGIARNPSQQLPR